MLNEDTQLLDAVNRLVESVGSEIQLNGEVGNAMFPDRVIVSLHNHIGNVKQFVSDETLAFNAAEQFLSLKSAINELQAALEDLYLLQHKEALNQVSYHALVEQCMTLDQQLRRATDTDYALE